MYYILIEKLIIMKKYSGYWKLLVLTILLALVGMVLAYVEQLPTIAALMCAVLLVVGTALGCMPDSDKYKSV
jgi:hypothetical protein